MNKDIEYETVIGLEVHAELATESKIFCACSTRFGAEPNSHVCPVCLGQPGVLPVLNEVVVAMAVKAGLALNCRIASYSKFDRKNYFYPDLPKAYQISQYDLPLAGDGALDIETDGVKKRIGITRVHIEEDAGKLMHDEGGYSCIDYNRTGVPLIEIVSEPDMNSPGEARAYLEKLKSYLQYMEVSDCKMEEGSLRCDANISLRPAGSQKLGTKIELKNMNSFKAVEKALEHEVERQRDVLTSGGTIIQETRRFDEASQRTVSMRSKEEAHDYRYFPDPDLPPVEVSREWQESIRAELPELPDARRERFVAELGLSRYDAEVITASKKMADFFEACLGSVQETKTVVNWVMGELTRMLKEENSNLDDMKMTPGHLVGLLKLQAEGVLSGKMAKEVFEEAFKTGKAPADIVAEKGLRQITDTGEIEEAVLRVLKENPNSVQDYKAGKQRALGFLVGQVMKVTKGRANPQLANELLIKNL